MKTSTVQPHHIFNPSEWDSKVANPFWYEDVPMLIAAMRSLHDTDRALYEITKESIYDFFERHILAGTVALGAEGQNWDAARLPIDTIVIHHTSNTPGLSLERLSAIELVRLYAPEFAKDARKMDGAIANGQKPEDCPFKRVPIYSHHFREGKQVFWPYHWMIRGDGRAERLLYDGELGWHAGNHDINRRSIAICIDDDHEDTVPSKEILTSIAELIRREYKQVTPERVFGHCEINLKTTCPSKLFLDGADGKGWKSDLLGVL